MDSDYSSLVPIEFYDTVDILNRLGQMFYKSGEVNKAKLCFLIANYYSGNFVSMRKQTNII